jgi:ATP-binding cassette subfamily F protein uup
MVDVVAGGYVYGERMRNPPLPLAGGAGGGQSRTQQAHPSIPSRKREWSKKLSYKDQRDLDLLPGRIEELEAAIARDEAALGDPDLYVRDQGRFQALTAAIEAARAEREAAEERWLELAEQADALAGR